jgi:hypothetical protein
LQGKPLKVDFVSILTQMQRMVGLSQTERVTSYIGNLAAAFPEAADKLNVDEAIDDYADRAGSPPKIIRSDDDGEKLRAARQQQQAQAAAAPCPRRRMEPTQPGCCPRRRRTAAGCRTLMGRGFDRLAQGHRRRALGRDDVIAKLEEALETAKTGKISSLAIAVVDRDGTVGHCWSKHSCALSLLMPVSIARLKAGNSWAEE